MDLNISGPCLTYLRAGGPTTSRGQFCFRGPIDHQVQDEASRGIKLYSLLNLHLIVCFGGPAWLAFSKTCVMCNTESSGGQRIKMDCPERQESFVKTRQRVGRMKAIEK